MAAVARPGISWWLVLSSLTSESFVPPRALPKDGDEWMGKKKNEKAERKVTPLGHDDILGSAQLVAPIVANSLVCRFRVFDEVNIVLYAISQAQTPLCSHWGSAMPPKWEPGADPRT